MYEITAPLSNLPLSYYDTISNCKRKLCDPTSVNFAQAPITLEELASALGASLFTPAHAPSTAAEGTAFQLSALPRAQVPEASAPGKRKADERAFLPADAVQQRLQHWCAFSRGRACKAGQTSSAGAIQQHAHMHVCLHAILSDWVCNSADAAAPNI